jgi:membrane protein implicated in regulation of membrane protease activity
MEFSDLWLWLIFVAVGLFFVLLELILGVETGLDLVFIGSIFIIGGLVTWPFTSWVLTVIVTSIVCIIYVVLGRRYVHRWTLVRKAIMNVDAIIGRQGIVVNNIANNVDGLVKVGYEQWRARAEEDIKEGDEIVVTGISGVTLIVKKIKGGD